MAARRSLDSDHGDPFTLLNAFREWLRIKVCAVCVVPYDTRINLLPWFIHKNGTGRGVAWRNMGNMGGGVVGGYQGEM